MLGYNFHSRKGKLEPSEVLKSRLLKGIEVYKSITARKKILIISGCTTVHVVRADGGFKETLRKNTEEHLRKIALQAGVFGGDLFIDTKARSTIDNCIYGLHIAKAVEHQAYLVSRGQKTQYGHFELQDVLEEVDVTYGDLVREEKFNPYAITTLHIVTSEFHMQRSKKIFQHFRCEELYQCYYHEAATPVSMYTVHCLVERNINICVILAQYDRNLVINIFNYLGPSLETRGMDTIY